MFTYNYIANLFLVIVNNISYNKLEVEKIILKKEGFFQPGVEKYLKYENN